MNEQQIKDELARLDAEDAAKNVRLNKIKEIAENNARVGLDQNQIDEYEDNMNDSIVEMFPDCTTNEWNIAADIYNKIVGRLK